MGERSIKTRQWVYSLLGLACATTTSCMTAKKPERQTEPAAAGEAAASDSSAEPVKARAKATAKDSARSDTKRHAARQDRQDEHEQAVDPTAASTSDDTNHGQRDDGQSLATASAGTPVAAYSTADTKDQLASRPTATPMTGAETTPLTDPPLPPTAKKTSAAEMLHQGQIAKNQISSCTTLVNRTGAAYRQLFSLLPPGGYVRSGTPLEQLAFSEVRACTAAGARTALFQTAIDAVSKNSGRIGLILPLSGPLAKPAASIVAGLRSALAETGKRFEQVVVLKDSTGSAAVADARLAELVYTDQVAMVLGGFTHAEATALNAWADKLLMPVLLLNRDRELPEGSRYSFMVYPDEDRLATTLAQAASLHHYKRIAILHPSSGKSAKVSAYFKQAVTATGGQIALDLAYTAGNFDSMQAASRQLFRTGSEGREEELREAYKVARKEAEDAGTAFNPRLVILRPIVDVDAVFIPDDFRTVRYFAKIFKYQMVDHVALIGNHEWRSPALIDPYDEFLNGAIFADFIGNYNKLPAAITAATPVSPFFVEPKNVETVDFQLIGYRVGKLAAAAMSDARSAARRQLPSVLMSLTAEASDMPGHGQLFDRNHHCYWPTYVFAVKQRGLEIEHSAELQQQQLQPQRVVKR